MKPQLSIGDVLSREMTFDPSKLKLFSQLFDYIANELDRQYASVVFFETTRSVQLRESKIWQI